MLLVLDEPRVARVEESTGRCSSRGGLLERSLAEGVWPWRLLLVVMIIGRGWLESTVEERRCLVEV
jgi:hypothetical protein